MADWTSRGRSATSIPSTSRRPRSGFSSPAASRIRVVLPAPSGPMSPVTRPLATDRVRPARASMVRPLGWKVLVRSSRIRAGSFAVAVIPNPTPLKSLCRAVRRSQSGRCWVRSYRPARHLLGCAPPTHRAAGQTCRSESWSRNDLRDPRPPRSADSRSRDPGSATERTPWAATLSHETKRSTWSKRCRRRPSASLGDCRKIMYRIAKDFRRPSRSAGRSIAGLCDCRRDAEGGRKDE